jgi:hypothetical protein
MMAVIEPERMSSRDILDDHPSLSASLEDFEHNGTYSEHNRAPLLALPSHHSGFARSEDGESSIHSDSGSAFLPPGERRFGPGSVSASGLMGWSKHRPYQQDLRPASMLASRVSVARAIERNAPEDIDGHAAEVRLAANVRLPSDSPIRRSPSPSPAPPEKQDEGVRSRQGSAGVSSDDAFEQPPSTDATNSNNNCMSGRFPDRRTFILQMISLLASVPTRRFRAFLPGKADVCFLLTHRFSSRRASRGTSPHRTR